MEPTQLRAARCRLSVVSAYHHPSASTHGRARAAVRAMQNRAGLVLTPCLPMNAVMADRKRRLAAAGPVRRSIADGVAIADPWGTQVRLVATGRSGSDVAPDGAASRPGMVASTSPTGLLLMSKYRGSVAPAMGCSGGAPGAIIQFEIAEHARISRSLSSRGRRF